MTLMTEIMIDEYKKALRDRDGRIEELRAENARLEKELTDRAYDTFADLQSENAQLRAELDKCKNKNNTTVEMTGLLKADEARNLLLSDLKKMEEEVFNRDFRTIYHDEVLKEEHLRKGMEYLK
jgi:hypothetical protein